MTAALATNNLYFIDATLPDLATLLAGLPPGAEVHLMEAGADGVQLLADTLAGRSDIEAIHLLTHGSAGSLNLGSSTLTSSNLGGYSTQWATIKIALSTDADFLIYGCNVAEGEAGATFISELASLTGADVAASTDLTGAGSLGGDWVLEAATGGIEATAALSASAQAAYQHTLPLGAHSATSGSEVFLGGAYIELGISSVGSFGTSAAKPAGFNGTSGSSAIGMSNDADGFSNGTDLAIDYFLPGSPEERWAAGYNGSTTGGYSNLSGVSGAALSANSVTNQSSGDNLSAKFTGIVGGALKVEQTHSFKTADKFFKTTVTLTNTTGSTMTDVRFMRSFDPDNTVFKGGNYDTVNKVEKTIAANGQAVVSATSKAGDAYNTAAGSTAKILFFSSDSRANVANFGFSNSDPYAMPVQAAGYTTTSDSGIAIMFKGGSLAAGASVTFEYFTSLDTADIATTITKIEAASNPAPTLTVFAAPVVTGNEDTQVTITYANLAAQGNEADQQPDASGGLVAGTVSAFVVTSITSGSLKIGTSEGSATAWNPGTNDVIDATHQAYWTPGANANGNLNAFKVVARDADGLKSTPALETPVTVTAINDAPVIASNTTPVSLPAINEDQTSGTTTGNNAGATVASLFGPRFTDVDSGATLGGVIVVSNTNASGGQWQYSTDGSNWFDIGAVTATSGLALSADTALRFSPEANYHGTPSALQVYLTDNTYTGGYTSGASRDLEASTSASGVSSNSTTLGTVVNSVNDLPVFDSAPGAAFLTETAAYDSAVTTASGALTGTLTGNDTNDSGEVTFGIRGGTGTTTVTKVGFYGTLTLNTSTNAWTYTPTNFVAINALAVGIAATDNFEFKVIDGSGASVTQPLVITITGTNDTPVLKAGADPIADQTFNGNGAWSYQIPADIFTDAEGLGLTYTVQVVDGIGTVLDTITSGTGGTTTLPSNWLIFNEASRTLSGTPTATAPLPLNLKITATDPSGAAVSDTFTVTLVTGNSDANPTPGNVAPTSNNDHIDTVLGTDKILAITDFGSYSDANGDAQSGIKITSLPASGTLQKSSDGTNWTAVSSGDVISKAEIDAGHLKLVPGSAATSIGFQVGDGTAFSGSYTLSSDVQTSAVTFAASTATTAAANTWTNVYGVDPLLGFSGTVRVVVDATGGKVKLTDTTGVTAITTGYGSLTDGSATSIAFEGALSDVNAALRKLQTNLATNPAVTLNISAIKGGAAYNPDNGHYYEVVTSGSDISWASAQTGAAGKSFNGLTGYLATITSATENAFILGKIPSDAWIGASDAATEGTWKWVTGPEAGTTFSIGNTTPVTQSGQYANWNGSEPNDSGADEDYAEFFASGGTAPGKWNDLAGTTGIQAYIVEYGGIGTVTEQASRTITLTATPPAPVLSMAGDAAYTENAAPKALNPALQITDLDSTMLASATVTISGGKVTGDTLAFTNVSATMGNILANYDAGTGVLSLSSAGNSATLAQWVTALKSITFASTSDNPGSGARSISWQVTDPQSNISNIGSTSIAVTPVNDAPVVTTLPDVDATAGTAFNLTLGTVFSDPEGTAITYSAQYLNGAGVWTAIPASGTSYWLTFDPATKAFTGNPPAGLPDLKIKVIGSDGSASGETTFTLNLATSAAGVAAENNGGAFSISDGNGGAVALGDTLTATAPTDDDGYNPAGLHYQWQAKASGGNWTDIDGATSATYVITQAESSKLIRAQAYYTDNGGFAEAPLSNEMTVPALNLPGVATITGAATPGQTLIATLQDANGLAGVTPTYTWYRGATAGAQTDVVGGNFSAYTLTNDDGGKYITVKITYTDGEGTVEAPVGQSGLITLGAVAPGAVNDTGAANEAGGVDNATAGSDATGNLVTNDTDQNTTVGLNITGLRSGSAEGLGEIGLLEGTDYVVSGDYGTLTVNKTTGAYTYRVNQSNYSVQELNSGNTVKDYFNYTVTDTTLLSDMGVLEITIGGANDAPSVRDVPTVFTVVEDQKTALVIPSTFALSDPDNTGPATVKLAASEGKITGATSGGVTVTGSDSGTLTLVGTLADINTWLKTPGNVSYTSAPNNIVGTVLAAATITLTANDGVSGFVTLTTVNVNVTDTNNAPILDLNLDNSTAAGVVPANATGADLTGNDHAVVFRPRGGAVQVVDSDITITDSIDGDTTLVSATVEITNGAWDNSRNIYETLSSTSGASYVGASGTITITGNGTGTGGLTDATKLTLSGTATHADYQNALKTVVYNNTNDGAFAGNRTITITVQDKAIVDNGLVSNVASFTTTAVNNSIAVGQKILIGGVDSGYTVSSVGADHQHFIASGPLTTLANNSALTFWLDGTQVTTATASAPLAATGYAAGAATSTVMVLWTPVVDLSGSAVAGTGYTTSYTEGGAGSYVAGTEALITDLDGNLKTVTVTLTNPLDTASAVSTESLFIASNIVTNLAANGITTTWYDASDNSVASTAAGIHKIVFAGNKDATTFQQGLREVRYKNTSENPSVTPRNVTTSIIDQQDNTGVSATTTIGIIPVNDAPIKGGDYAGALNEGAVHVFTNADLNSTDVDNTIGTLKYILTSVPDAVTEGVLFRDSNNNGVVDAGEALNATADTSSALLIKAITSTGYFTQAEVDAGQIKYKHSGANPDGINLTGTDTFGFKVVDGMEDYAFSNVATNQSGTVTLTVTEVNDVATGTPVVTGTMTPGQVLTVNTSSVADADGPATPTFTYQWQTYNGTTWEDVGSSATTYTLQASDQGKQVRVQVSFQDAFVGHALNTLTGAATGTVAFTNTGGTGGVSVTNDGTPQAGETLTADTSALTDADGLGPLSYQWAVSTDNGTSWTPVGGATSKTYALPGDAATSAQYKAIVSYTDGRGNAENIDSAAVTVVAPAADINDAPVLTGDGSFGAAAVGATSLFSGVAVSTVEAGQTIKTLTLTVSGLQDGVAEKLTVDGVQVDLADAVTTAITYPAPLPAGALGGVSYAISVTGGEATVTLTHVGLTEAQTKTLVEGLTFANTAGAPVAGLRVVTLTTLVDDAVGTTGGFDTGTIGISATVDIGDSLGVTPSSNTAPTVTTGGVYNTATVAEAGVVTIANTLLAATDTEQPGGLKVVLASTPTHGTLFRDLNGNGIMDGAETALTSGSKFALADIAANRIKYLHDGSETTSDSFTFNVSDGLALTDSDSGAVGDQATNFTITVTPVNDIPTLTATAAGTLATPVAFAEGDAAKALFTATAASAVDTGQNITELKVMVSGLRDGAAEILVVGTTQVALTHDLVSKVASNGVNYTVSVTGGTATVTLTKTDTGSNWNGFVNGLKYENTSQNPTEGVRAVTLVNLKDDGGDHNTSELAITSRVNVTAVNDVPVVTSGAGPVSLAENIAVSTVVYTATATDVENQTLTYSLSGADASAFDINSVTGAVTLKVSPDFETKSSYSFNVLATDSQAGVSSPQAVVVTVTNVNEAPRIDNLGTDLLTYPASSGAKGLEQGGDVLVVDDSANFNSGSLRASIGFNRDPAHDTLTIQNVGAAPGQISVGAGTVSYAGTQIGTFTGGTGTADLVVTFDSNATPTAVTALIKAIQFSNDQAAPALTSRTVSFTLNDGGTGGQAAPVSVNVNLQTGVTPSISIGNGFFVMENTQLVTALSATDPNSRPITFSVDSTVDGTNNPDQAKFEIVSGNLLRFKAAPDYEIPDDAGVNRVYNVIVKASNDLGSTATQALTITLLDQNPEGGVAVGDTSGPAFGFATVNGNTLVMTFTDASNLDATNLPLTSAFAVSGNTVTGVAVNATAKTVTLTLGTAVVAGAAVTVSYTDPTTGNDVAALQDAAGNDAASLAATAVSNVTPSTGGGGGGGSPAPTPPGGTTTTADAQGNTTVNNTGTTSAVVTAPTGGGTVTTTGSGPTTVTAPSGEVTLNNTGTGTVTTSGIRDSATLNITGTGNQVVDLSGVPAGQTVTIDNKGTGTVDIKNLPDGVIVNILGVGPVSLNDADGATPNVENNAPAKTGGHLGDGNGDGVADALQSNVTSIPFLNTPTAQSNPSNAPSIYVSLVADSRNGNIDTADSNTASLSNQHQLDRPADAPDSLQMPIGLIAFSANVGFAGTTETFSLFVDASLAVNGYWKKDPISSTWVNLASPAFGGQVVSDGGKTRLDFQITDGGRFDSDGKADGVITDPGAAGYFQPSNPNDTDNDQFPDALEFANGLTVGIKDNDVFTSSKFFAMQLYRDILYREGETAGVAYWQGRIDAGLSRAEAAVAFLDSPEFQSGTGAIARLYFGALQRLPDAPGMSFWMDQQQTGTTISQVAAAFVASTEFTALYGSLNDTAFIQSQYQSVLGRAATAQEQTQWGAQLAAGASRGVVSLGLTESAEYTAASDVKLSVALDYLGLLGRPAEQAGFDWWVNQQSSSIPEVTVVGGFIASPEYHDRFLP
ncbi:MAG: DUF4347 domain-containing protein [Rhodoferax sp.]|uniref:DUF4347 domain-containing protein n=1 Tax=Rhodoferax sp. TaxID=50421 RepID=UPI002634F3DC|nr:DUF4347 domain-containing protein [Rhodoferax sp.]MDD2880336.1 DUF4347 domain-containing protein [Rhodoferax sp.]